MKLNIALMSQKGSLCSFALHTHVVSTATWSSYYFVLSTMSKQIAMQTCIGYLSATLTLWPAPYPLRCMIIFTGRRYATSVYAVVVCLSVCPSLCPSVTSRHCTKTAKLSLTGFDALSPVHTSNNVEATLSNATSWTILSTMSNVASTLLLIWTGLNASDPVNASRLQQPMKPGDMHVTD